MCRKISILLCSKLAALMTKFLLIDDHYVVRSGTKGFLFEYFKPCQVDEASDGTSAIEKIKSGQYDLILMDVQMPNTDTFGLVEHFHIRYPDSKMLMFSMAPENIYAKRFLRAGAMGFLSKESPPEEIQKAIMLVLSGRKYISNSLAVILAEESFESKKLLEKEKKRLEEEKTNYEKEIEIKTSPSRFSIMAYDVSRISKPSGRGAISKNPTNKR